MRTKVKLPNGIGMAEIGPSKNTRPERVVRMWLVRNGHRHEVHKRFDKYTVDLVVDGWLAIEVHGRFWHCPRRSKMRSMSSFWAEKLDRNVGRDRRKARLLSELGFKRIVIWDDEIGVGSWRATLSRLLRPHAASSGVALTCRKRIAGRRRGSRSHPGSFARGSTRSR